MAVLQFAILIDAPGCRVYWGENAAWWATVLFT
jgi:hypothetical protein